MALTTEDIERIRQEERVKIQDEARRSMEIKRSNEKSIAMALLWTVLFGCFGLFYISVTAGIISSVVGLMVMFLMPAGAPAVWVISVIASVVLVMEHNKNA